MLTNREQRLIRKISEEMMARRDEICRGSLEQRQYDDLCGLLRGLQWSLDTIEENLREDDGRGS